MHIVGAQLIPMGGGWARSGSTRAEEGGRGGLPGADFTAGVGLDKGFNRE